MKSKPVPASNKNTSLRTSTSQVRNEDSFPIVAIGASAGGLEAITELLKNLPAQTGMAFIYVQHLSAEHKSLLTSLLSKATSMKVQDVDDMDKIKPDNVFVIPHDKALTVTDGHIHLIPRSSSREAITIDVLFASLAESQKERVIGIILSGSGRDGTVGMKAIKQLGGLTFAQDDSAKFKSMPQSAIAAGIVDYVLSPKEIALELAHISEHPLIKSNGAKSKKGASINDDDADLKFILKLVQQHTGVDFSLYKVATIKRRIIRRLLLHKKKTLTEYRQLLHEKTEEINTLYQDLLINVTGFFREPETYRYLKKTLFPKLIRTKKNGDLLRIWVSACSTGEEAYSIAMMLIEIMDTLETKIRVQIFATDLSQKSISKARIGMYSRQDLEVVSPQRLQRFFTKADDRYRIIKDIRDMCVFAPHNILTDPPFSRIDFVSCCNLFIYLDITAQKKAIATFHYSLNEGGYMMLGKSETVSNSSPLFTIVNKKFKIYCRKKTSGPKALPVLSPRLSKLNSPPENPMVAKTIDTKEDQKPPAIRQSLDKAIDDALVSDFMPASAVINHDLEIQQFRGSTELYLTHAPGKASLNILKMARPEIAFELRNAIAQTIKTNLRTRKSGVEVKVKSAQYSITFDIMPLPAVWDEPLLLIVFSEQKQVANLSGPGKLNKLNPNAKDLRIKKLEEELVASHTNALAYSQEQEALTEELQSANEEVVSSNEELQTLNEELETSKEEIESTNEELITTNQELQTRNDLLEESYRYSEAIITTIHEPLLVLDKNLRVKSANSCFYKTFKAKAEETEGVHFYELGKGQWDIPQLRRLLDDTVQKNVQFVDYEVQLRFPRIGKKIMLLNARRIVQETNSEQLVLLAIYDATEMRKKADLIRLKENKLLEKELAYQKAEKEFSEKLLTEQIEAEQKIATAFKDADAYIRNIFMQAPVSIVVYKGPSFIIDMINEKGLEMWGTTYNETINRPLFELYPAIREKGLEKILTRVFTKGVPYIVHESPVPFLGDGTRLDGFFNIVFKPIQNLKGTITGIISIATNVTQEVLTRKQIEESEKQFRQIADSMPQIVWTALPDGQIDYFNKQWYSFTGFEENIVDQGWVAVLHPEDAQVTIEAWEHAVRTGDSVQLECRFKDTGHPGSNLWFMCKALPVRNAEGKILKWYGTFTEIQQTKIQSLGFEDAVKQRTNELRQANQWLEEKNKALEKMNTELEAFNYVSSHDLQEPLRKIQMFVDRLAKTELPNLSAHGKDMFKRVSDSANRMQTLIQDLLEFSRVKTAGREVEITDLNVVVQDVLSEFHDAIEEKRVVVKAGELCSLNVIPFLFHQLMHNLISNAIKFAKPDKPLHIQISSSILAAAESPLGKESCHIMVADNGIGFEQEHSEQIFKLFQKLHSKDEYEGTGVGLSIVKKIVDNHHGTISATGEINNGATFHIYLPV